MSSFLPATIGMRVRLSSLWPSLPGRSLCSARDASGSVTGVTKRTLPPGPDLSSFLRDTYGRQHTYLRVSLTERCNLRCTYCMPEEGVPLSQASELLSRQEIARAASLFARHGVDKVRLTGGEPTVRADLADIVRSIKDAHPGIKSVGMTTNGIALTLGQRLETLVASGLDAVNISLDTLVEPKFDFITRRRGLQRVLAAIEKCAGTPGLNTKVNCVVMRGLNDDEVVDFAGLAERLPVTVRFIEYMPFDGNKWTDRRLVPYKELLAQIGEKYPLLVRDSDTPNDTSRHYKSPDWEGRIGFIASMTDHFCGTCNRVRLTADGNLKACLFGEEEVSLRDAMRKGATDGELMQLVGGAIGRKAFSHGGTKAIEGRKNRPMITIGG